MVQIPEGKRTERYRKAAYGLFFLSLGVLLFGFIPAMYYGSLIGVSVTLTLAAVLFLGAFIAGGVGWSTAAATTSSEAPHYRSRNYIEPGSRPGDYSQSAAPPPAPGEEEALPRPHPSDESRPPIE